MHKLIGLLVTAVLTVSCSNLDGSNLISPSSISIGGADSGSNLREALGDLKPNPDLVNGVDLRSLNGWLANKYPWEYTPETSTVHPVPRLWTPFQKPSYFELKEQCSQIKEYGGSAVVLEYSPNPALLDWHNYWLSVDWAASCGPFFLLYENINGTRFTPIDGGLKDMSDPYNRQAFKEDVKFMFENVILPNQSRYITVDGRAVIYMWVTTPMVGDFGSLLEEVKKVYPIFFIGGGEMGQAPIRQDDINRVKALDGFMDYGSLGGGSTYLAAVQNYAKMSVIWRKYIEKLGEKTGKKYLMIPTFSAAYDDTKVVPPRNNLPMYPRNRNEVLYHAELIRQGLKNGTYDRIRPFVVYNENLEGSAVIESQCLPETLDRQGRYVGCGTARLEILKEYSRKW